VILGKQPIGTISYLGGLMSLPEQFAFSLAQMVQYNTEFLCKPGEYCHLDRSQSSFHTTARNALASRMMGDWILMLDTDHEWEPDLLARMLAVFNQYNIDVLTALYLYKNPPHLPTIYWWNEESKSYNVVADMDWNSPLVEISCAGAGCLLVRRSVFERIRYELREEPFDIIPPLSEDFSFFTRLRRLNIKAYCCPQIHSYHLTMKPVTLEDYDRSAVQVAPIPQQKPLVGTTMEREVFERIVRESKDGLEDGSLSGEQADEARDFLKRVGAV
jgi:glycosyltransferase involved in cell wall biosynthesis